jgi:uncharacterized protein
VVAIVSDTHMPKGRRELPLRCLELLRAAELIVHAGDFSGAGVLERFEALGSPLVAVHGNVEAPAVRARLPARIEFDYRGHRVGVVHDAGPRQGRLRRLRHSFPEADAVIFGHSHLPLLERDDDGFQIFNPGSPTERRRAPHHTMGLLRAADSGLVFEFVEL